MSLTLTFTLEDAQVLFHTGMGSAQFREEEHNGRFVLSPSEQELGLPELTIASPSFDNGSLLWCATVGDALLLKKIHQAAGFEAYILGDNASDDDSSYYTVLSSWNIHEGEIPLTEDRVVSELLITGPEAADSAIDLLLQRIKENSSVRVLGEPSTEDHDDHFHATLLVELPGNQLIELVGACAHAIQGAVGYKVITQAQD